MSTMNFPEAFDRLIGNEGGYVNRPDDPGGETNWGITWPILRRAIGEGIIGSGTTIATLSRGQAATIYEAYFWRPLGDIDGAIKFQVFDFAVNSGIETAIRKLQHAIGVADDGHWGPISAAKLASLSVPSVLMLFVAERLDFWHKLSNWPVAGAGWAGRAATDLRFAAHDIT